MKSILSGLLAGESVVWADRSTRALPMKFIELSRMESMGFE